MLPLLNRVLIIALPLLLFLVTVIACSRPPVPTRTLPAPLPSPIPPTVPDDAGAAVMYSDPAQPIEIKVGEPFGIKLKSNPTTGYGWQESHDQSAVQLIDKTFASDTPVSTPPIVGAGGAEIFRFKTLKAGETTITLVYQRPWETPSPIPGENQKVFTVRIN